MWGATALQEAGPAGVWAPESQAAGWSSAADLLQSQQHLPGMGAPLQPSGSPTTPGPWPASGLAPEGPGQSHSAASKVYVQVRGVRLGWQLLPAAPPPKWSRRRLPVRRRSLARNPAPPCRGCPQGLPQTLQHPVAVAGLFSPFGDVLDVKL